VLNSLFDDDREIRITQHHNEVVRPHADFRLFATMNPASYAGRAKISDAMMSRWTRLYCQGLTTQDVTTVMRAKYGDQLPQGELAKLIAAHQALSQAADSGAIGSSLGGVAFSLRNLMRVAQRFVRYRGGALSDDALMRREVEEVYRGGLPDPLDIQAVDDVLTAVMPHKGASYYDSLEFTETPTTFSIGDVTLRKLGVQHPDVPGERARLVMTRRTKEIFYRLAKALDNGENPLLIGDRASGKTAVAKMFAHVMGQPYYRQQISGSTDVMELVGGYDDQGWQDRPLLIAGRPDGHGGTLVLDEMNMGSSALLERLNPVLDDERQIVLAEKEGETIRMHPDLHIIGTMNPPSQKYGGRKKLSVAMQNRTTPIFVPELADKGEQKEILAVAAKHANVPSVISEALVELHHAVLAGYKDGTLGKDLSEDERPVLSIRQLNAALDTVAEFGKSGNQGAAYLRAVEAEYASSPSTADNAAILKLADKLAR
jgi:midasin